MLRAFVTVLSNYPIFFLEIMVKMNLIATLEYYVVCLFCKKMHSEFLCFTFERQFCVIANLLEDTVNF